MVHKHKVDPIMDTIESVLSKTHTIVSVMDINKMCNEVKAAVVSGKTPLDAAMDIVPKYHRS